MQFNKNKEEPVHRWYPFVEGYSKEFITSIIDEIDNKNIICLEPFSGSGTTALELQHVGLKCISFEVNPLMYLVSRVKLFEGYEYGEAKRWYDTILQKINVNKHAQVNSVFPTLVQNGNRQKWNLDLDVAIGVQNLLEAIKSIENSIYSDLYLVALASILMEVSNLYRNGKCLSYRADWREKQLSTDEVYSKFTNKVINEILPDIVMLQGKNNDKQHILVSNYDHLYLGDSRKEIETRVPDSSIDLVITSPPYLNSRDYTDTYMLELKTLGFTKSFSEITELREKTIRSHVQIKWKDITCIDNALLQDTLAKLEVAKKAKKNWNSSIIDMIRLYFVDIDTIFGLLAKKLKNGGKVYFNVSNSAYFNTEINTLEIASSIAEDNGFEIKEIRKARYLKTSPQQKKIVGKLLEGVIVMEKKTDE